MDSGVAELSVGGRAAKLILAFAPNWNLTSTSLPPLMPLVSGDTWSRKNKYLQLQPDVSTWKTHGAVERVVVSDKEFSSVFHGDNKGR